MQTTINTKVSSNNLSAALASLRNASSKWDQAENNMRQVDRYIGSADSEFRNADFPARRASFDNAATDSSWEGRQLDRHFRNGDRYLDNSQWDMRSAKREADGMGRDIDSGQSFLSSLETEYRQNNDPRLSQVQQAIAETNSSESRRLFHLLYFQRRRPFQFRHSADHVGPTRARREPLRFSRIQQPQLHPIRSAPDRLQSPTRSKLRGSGGGPSRQRHQNSGRAAKRQLTLTLKMR